MMKTGSTKNRKMISCPTFLEVVAQLQTLSEVHKLDQAVLPDEGPWVLAQEPDLLVRARVVAHQVHAEIESQVVQGQIVAHRWGLAQEVDHLVQV